MSGEAGSASTIVPGVPSWVSDNVRRIVAPNPSMMTGPGTNTYLVGHKDCVVIDPGPEIESHLESILQATPDGIGGILLTHTHPDHAPLAEELSRVTGAPVIGMASSDDVSVSRTIADGETVDADGLTLRALHTPGHVYDHHCYLLEEEGLVFSGDHIMEGSTVVIIPPEGDMGDYLSSLKKLRDLVPAISRIAPGHGQMIEDPGSTIDAYISHRLDRERMILDAIPSGEDLAVPAIVSVAYVGTPDHLLPVAQYSAWAHLRKLEKEGVLISSDNGTLASTWRRA